jgi:hypothetical protein
MQVFKRKLILIISKALYSRTMETFQHNFNGKRKLTMKRLLLDLNLSEDLFLLTQISELHSIQHYTMEELSMNCSYAI